MCSSDLIYFGWFWSHGGQTVAMRAWRIRLVTAQGGAVSEWRAVLRYLLAWLWFAPALLVSWTHAEHSTGEIFGTLAAGVLLYAGLARLLPGGQFLHDRLCGTRLVDWPPRGAPAANP